MTKAKILFTVALIAFFGSCYWGSRQLVKQKFEYSLDNLQASDSLVGHSAYANSALECTPTCPAVHELFVLKYFIGYRSGYHLEIASKYYYNYHALSMMLIISSIGLGLCTFLLAKKGWDNEQNDYVKITFVVSFFFSSMFGLFVSTLKMEENFQVNLDKYNAITKIQLDIHSYLVEFDCSGTNLGAFDCDSLHIISNDTRKRIIREIDLAAGVDFKSIPMKIIPEEH